MNDPYQTPEVEPAKSTEDKPKVESNISALVPIGIGVFVTAMILWHAASKWERFGPFSGMANFFTLSGTLTNLILVWIVVLTLLLVIPVWRAYAKFVAPILILTIVVFILLSLNGSIPS